MIPAFSPAEIQAMRKAIVIQDLKLSITKEALLKIFPGENTKSFIPRFQILLVICLGL
jgi:hypothetical protein